MSYKVTGVTESRNYEAAGHYDVRTTRLHDAEDVGGTITLGLSHFLPGGGSEMAKASKELIYYIVEGQMTVSTDDGKSHVLNAGDSIHMSPYQGRSCKNNGHSTAKMLVIACPATNGQ
jgi:quercetin dioxygenase-like cupin family protein